MVEGLETLTSFLKDVQFNIDPKHDIKDLEQEIINQLPEHTLPNQFYYVINNYSNECVYVSDSIAELTGYKPDEWVFQHIINIVHPDDKPFVDKALYACYKLTMSPQKYRPIKDALILNYRIKHKDGHYIHILRTGYCASMDASNNMVHNVSMCMVISDFKQGDKQSMFLKEGNKVIVEMHSDNSKLLNLDVLSKREIEITELLCDNKTSEQISQQLFISKHTVDTHRRKILKKLNLKNTTELLFVYLNK